MILALVFSRSTNQVTTEENNYPRRVRTVVGSSLARLDRAVVDF